MEVININSLKIVSFNSQLNQQEFQIVILSKGPHLIISYECGHINYAVHLHIVRSQDNCFPEIIPEGTSPPVRIVFSPFLCGTLKKNTKTATNRRKRTFLSTIYNRLHSGNSSFCTTYRYTILVFLRFCWYLHIYEQEFCRQII